MTDALGHGRGQRGLESIRRRVTRDDALMLGCGEPEDNPVASRRAVRALPTRDVVFDKNRARFERSASKVLAEWTHHVDRPEPQVVVFDLGSDHARFAGRLAGLLNSSSRVRSPTSSPLSSETRTFAPIATATAALWLSPKGFARSKITLVVAPDKF